LRDKIKCLLGLYLLRRISVAAVDVELKRRTVCSCWGDIDLQAAIIASVFLPTAASGR
jgi:hypothetical protein